MPTMTSVIPAIKRIVSSLGCIRLIILISIYAHVRRNGLKVTVTSHQY